MKNKGLLIFNIIFIGIGIIAVVSSIYVSKPINANEIQYHGIKLSETSFEMTISGSNNPSYKLEKIEQTVIDDTLFLTFYETIFNGDTYPYKVKLTGDYHNVTSVKINDRNNIKEIYP